MFLGFFEVPLNNLLNRANLEPFTALHAHKHTFVHGHYPDPLVQNTWNWGNDALHFDCIDELAENAILELIYHLVQVEYAHIFVHKKLPESLCHSYVLLELSLRGLVFLRLLISNSFGWV